MHGAYELITDEDRLRKLLNTLYDCSCEAALDFETTALRPADGRVRLASISNQHGTWVVDFDQMFKPHRETQGFKRLRFLFGVARHFTWWVFNSGFEMRWFIDDAAHHAHRAGELNIRDIGYLRAAIMGGGRYRLAQLVEWDLGIKMSKAEQTSNWDDMDLTPEQLQYSADDATLTWRLVDYWRGISNIEQDQAGQMFDDMVPAVIEMEEQGMLLDQSTHSQLCIDWKKLEQGRCKQIRDLVPADEVANINSGVQWSNYFSKLMPAQLTDIWPKVPKGGHLSTAADSLRMVEVLLPPETPPWSNVRKLLQLLRERNKLTKYISSFGDTLVTKAQMDPDGRVRARFNIAAAKTGRFSSSGPNLQQIPRDQNDFFGIDHMSIRKSFIAPKGSKLVVLDYSGIELRVLALLSGDKQLIHDTVFGDVHSEVASFMAGRPIDKHIPEDKAIRSKAKGVSFGIIYGSGAGGLSATLGQPLDVAQDYILRWQDRYPAAFRYRFNMQSHAQRTGYLPMIDGGTIYVSKKPELPKCANYPVQRAALTIMARAIARHKVSLDAYRRARPRVAARIRLLSTIHDALIDEAPARSCKRIYQMMETDMIAGYRDVFPGAPINNLVEGGIGPSWADTE